jgi:hypothetical protein
MRACRFVLLLLLAAIFYPARSQTRSLTVCEAYDRHISSGQDVVIQALIAGESHHGYYLIESLSGEACPGWPKRFFTAPPFMGLAFGSFGGVQVSKEQERADMAFLDKLWQLSRAKQFSPFRVLVSGVIVKKSWSMTFRLPIPIWSGGDPIYQGNGWGAYGEIPALIVAKSIREDGTAR